MIQSKKLLYFAFFIPFFLFSLNSYSQTGPGGVGNSDGSNGEPANLFWLRADSLSLTDNESVNQWNDVSGNNRHYNQITPDNQPTFRNSVETINGLPAVIFDGTDDFLEDLDADSYIDGLSGFTLLTVIQSDVNTGSDAGIFDTEDPDGQDDLLSIRYDKDGASYGGTDGIKAGINTTGGQTQLESSSNIQTTDSLMLTMKWSSGSELTLYENDGLKDTPEGSDGALSGNITGTQKGVIGRGPMDNGGPGWDGAIAEMILYDVSLNDAQRTIVENYLSAKYNITITNDYFTGNGVYLNGIAGIGQESNGDHTKANSDGFIITQNGGLNDGDYVIFAHDNKRNDSINEGTEVTNNTDVVAAWYRDWYVEKTDASPGLSGKIAFDIGDGFANGKYPQEIENYRLLYRANSSDNYDTVDVSNRGIENTDQVYFTVNASEFTTGYYTLGTVDESSSPVEGAEGRTWYTLISGNWENWEIWTLDPSGALPDNPDKETPSKISDNVVILSGNTVTVNSDSLENATLQVDGRLDLQQTRGHSFGEIKGSGKILMAEDNFPEGDATDFITPGEGEGTVEYYGSHDTLKVSREFYDMNVNLDNSSDTLTLIADYTVNNNLNLTRGDLKINDEASTTPLNISVGADVFVSANASMSVGKADAYDATAASGYGNYYKGFHVFEIGGDMTNKGTIRFTNQSVPDYSNITGTGAVSLKFTGAGNNEFNIYNTTDLYNLVIDKGDSRTYKLELYSDDVSYFALYGQNDDGWNIGSTTEEGQNPENRKALWISNGRLELTGNIFIPSLSEGGVRDYTIGNDAALILNGTNVQVNVTADGATDFTSLSHGEPNNIENGTSWQGIYIMGKLQLNNGTFIQRSGEAINFRDEAPGILEINGGSLTANQIAVSSGASAGTYSYTQTGGTVEVNGNDNPDVNRALLHLSNPDMAVNMSGGEIHIAGVSTHDTNAVNIASDPSNINVSGGTLRLGYNGTTDVYSTAPIYNVIIDNGNTTLLDGELIVQNDLTINANAFLDHDGNDVSIGHDFYISENAKSDGANNYGYLYDPALPNTTTFNGTKEGTFYIGHPDSEADGWELYMNKLVLNKSSGKKLIMDSDPEKEASNVSADWHARIVRIDSINVESGILDQGYHSVRLVGNVVNSDQIGVYTGSTHDDALIMFAWNSYDIKTTSDAIFGNIKVNTGNNIVSFSSDVYIKRIWYRHGRLNSKNYNLKVDNIDYAMYNETQFDWDQNGSIENDEQGVNSPMDMFIFDGKASSGGLSLKITGNGTYKFPVGNGTDATEYLFNNSKYTPAIIDVTNFNDDGYIIINPVDHPQWSMIGDTTDALQHYWTVDYEGFNTVPDVQMDFYYHDLSAGEDVDGSESAYVPGRLINLNQWEEDDAGSVDKNNDIVEFSSGSLTRGDYTAGKSVRFNGTVRTLYARKDGEWHDPKTWSTTRDGNNELKNKNKLPEPGDICVIGNSTTNYSVAVSADNANYDQIQIARLSILRYGGGESSLVTVGQNGNDCDFGVVTNHDPDAADPTSTENHWSKIIVSGPELPDGDFGQFMKAPNTIFTFSRAFPGTNAGIDDEDGTTLGTEYYSSYTIGNDYVEYPVLQFEYSGYNGGHIELPDTNITVNHDIRFFKDDHRILMNDGNDGDVTVKKDIEFNGGNSWNIVFQSAGSERTLAIEGDINFLNNSGIFLAENTTSSLVHNLKLQGDVINVNNGSDFEFYTNSSNTRANFEFYGSGNSTIPNMNGLPSFNKIVMNKGTSQSDTAFLQTDFSLGADPGGTSNDKPIQLQNGVLELDNAAINEDISTGEEDFKIPSSSALIINQGQLNFSGNSGIFLDGKLKLAGGTVDMSGGDNYIEYSASGNAELEITAGNLTVGSQIRRQTSTESGILNYKQQGGEVVAGQNSAPEDNRGVFEILNAGSLFDFTGGDLYIANAQSNPSVASLYLEPDSSSISSNAILHIGHASTNSSQTIGINSNISIPKLFLDNSSTNNPTAKLSERTLTVTDTLKSVTGTDFDANGLDLYLKGDYVSNGGFTANGNKTYINGSANQEITGSPQFYDLYKTSNNTLFLNDPVTVNNYFRFESGVLSDRGNTLTVKGDIYNNAVHDWGEAGNGIFINGSSNQELKGNGTFGKLSIKNIYGLTIPEVGNNVYIDDALQLEKGVFDIGKNLLELDSNAVIIEKNAFSETNMIQTNISFTDAGIRKYFPAITSDTSFTYPIGSSGKYTPVEFDISNSSQYGYIRIKAANERHPSIVEDDESPDCLLKDSSNVLQYHWLIEGNNINNFDAQVFMYAEEEDVWIDNTCGYTEADYITARLLENNVLWNKYPPVSFDQGANRLNYSFSGANDEGITGDYTAGIDGTTFNGAIPDSVPVYHSAQNGNWKNNTTWEEDIAGGPKGSIVMIDDTVTVTKNFLVSYKTILEPTGFLRLESTFGHRLGLVSGQGTLSSWRGDLPAGDYEEFFSDTGGTLEYGGTNDLDILSGISAVNNLRFVNTGRRRFPNSNITLYGNLEILGDDANLEVINEYDRIWTIDSNIVFTQGSFDAGTGNSKVIMNGSSAQTITGDFTGDSAFYNLEINNSQGVTISGETEIDNVLEFTSGIITTTQTDMLTIDNSSETAVKGYGNSNYVDGPMQKLINDNGSFDFPVGDAGRYGEFDLISTNTSNAEYWEAQYYNENPHPTLDTSNYADPIQRVSANEYWRVAGPSAGASNVKIRWDDQSILPAATDDRSNLHIAEWITSTDPSEWQSKGNEIDDHGVDSGTVQTSSEVALEEHYFTLATAESVALSTAGFASSDTAICEGQSVELEVELTGDPEWEIKIFHEDTLYDTRSNISSSSETFVVSRGGTYTIDSVGDANGEGNVYGDPVEVTVASKPTVSAIEWPTPVCQYATKIYSVTDSSDYTYNWSVPTGNNSVTGTDPSTIQVEWETTGIQTLEVTVGLVDVDACSTTFSQEDITVNETPQPNIADTLPTVCYPNSIDLDASTSGTDYNYQWQLNGNNDGSDSKIYTFEPDKNPEAVSQQDTVSVSVVNNGCSDSDIQYIKVYRRPETGNQYYVPNEFDQ